MGATSDARFCCGKLGRCFWRRCTAKLPVSRQVRARPCPDGVYSHRRVWLFKTPHAEEIPGSSNSRWLRRGTTTVAIAIIVTSIWSIRPHTRTGERGGTRWYALVRFGFSDLNQVDLSFPPDRPGIRLTVFPLSRTTHALLSHPYTYLILSLGPSTLLRAWRWNALRARLPLFRGLPFPFVPTRSDSARSTPNAWRNRSTKYSWPACIVALEKRQARFRSSVLPHPHGTKSARSIWSDLLTVRFFKFGSDELCRFLPVCLAFF